MSVSVNVNAPLLAFTVEDAFFVHCLSESRFGMDFIRMRNWSDVTAGTRHAETFTASSNVLFVRFFSDGSTEKAGFNATFQAEDGTYRTRNVYLDLPKGPFTPSESERKSKKDQRRIRRDQRKNFKLQRKFSLSRWISVNGPLKMTIFCHS